MKKKGALSIETIIIIILALIVLVIVAAAFSGGMAELWKKISDVGKTTGEIDINTAKERCNSICTDTPTLFCTSSVLVTNRGPLSCKDLVSCSKAPC